MFGMERHHFLPFIGLVRHNRKTMHFMEVFEEKRLLRHAPGGILLSLYNASIVILAVFAVTGML